MPNALVRKYLLLVGLDNAGTAETTSTAGSNETNLLAGRSRPADSGSVTNVLMVTTTMGMLNRVHGNTTDLRPLVALSLVLVESTTSLEHRLLSTTTTSNLANNGTAGAGDNLLGTRGELDTGDAEIRVVGNDDGVVTGSTGKGTTVTGFLLDVADNGTLGHRAEGEDITNVQLGLLTADDVLASENTLGSNKGGLLGLVLVGVAEGNPSKGSTTTRVVDDVGDNTLNVVVPLSRVKNTMLSSALAVGGVGPKDRSATLTLGPNNTTHLSKRSR